MFFDNCHFLGWTCISISDICANFQQTPTKLRQQQQNSVSLWHLNNSARYQRQTVCKANNIVCLCSSTFYKLIERCCKHCARWNNSWLDRWNAFVPVPKVYSVVKYMLFASRSFAFLLASNHVIWNSQFHDIVIAKQNVRVWGNVRVGLCNARKIHFWIE